MRQRNEKRSKRQRMSKKRRRTTKKQRGGRIWQIKVLSEDKSYETITVFDEKKSFADNGIIGNETTKYYTTLSQDVEIDYKSIPSYPPGNNPVIIYKKNF